MKRLLVFLCAFLFFVGIAGPVTGLIIDFSGGTAYLLNGNSVTTTDEGLWWDVDYYEEEGMRIDFVGSGGDSIIGDYYSIREDGPNYNEEDTIYNNSVIHAHPFKNYAIVFTKIDGSFFDLNYVDMTSNTIVGGGQSSGEEESYITNNRGYSMRLPSSDWGFDYDFYGEPGDGVQRLWLDDNFDSITSFTLSSENAYCFGMDNFYIDEPPPDRPSTPVPEPSTVFLLGFGLIGLVGVRRRSKG
ncbi:MAG: PEP-CTERM sorting domain-containing protein [bacterium]